MKCNCKIPANINDFDLMNLPLDCEGTWNLIHSGKVKGCFQIEQNLGVHWCKEIKPDSVNELGSLIALIRPSCLEAITDGKNATKHYADRKYNKEESQSLHPQLEELLKETYQIIIFQEQAMQIAKDVANFDLKEADSLRHAIGKKDVKAMSEVKKLFIDKASGFGIINAEEAKYIFDIIEKSQRFSFNKSHAISYANYSYISAYIKYHFPLEFFCSWLTFAGDKPNPKLETKQLIQDAKTFDININVPYLPDLEPHCYIASESEKLIRFGLVDLAGIGESSFNKLIKIFKDKTDIIKNLTFIDFLLQFGEHIDQTSFKALIASGSIDYLQGKLSRQAKLYIYDKYLKLTEKEIRWISSYRNNNKEQTWPLDPIKEFSYILSRLAPVKKEGGGTHSENRSEVVRNLIKLIDNPPYSLDDSVDWLIEQEETLLGIALTASRLTASELNIHPNTTCREFSDGHMSNKYILAANIDSTRVVKTKKGKNPGLDMAFISLSDDSGAIDGVAFPDCWKENGRLLAEGRSVIVMGKRDAQRNSFMIEKVWSL